MRFRDYVMNTNDFEHKMELATEAWVLVGFVVFDIGIMLAIYLYAAWREKERKKGGY